MAAEPVFDLSITQSNEGYLAKLHRADGVGELEAQPFVLSLDDSDLLQYRRDVANWVRQTQILRLSSDSEELQLAREFGATLFRRLFRDELLASFRISRQLLQPGERLHLRLRLPDALAAIPWELLYDSLNRQFLALAPDIVLLRYPEVHIPVTPLQTYGPLRIVLAHASPNQYPRISLERDLSTIKLALQDLLERKQIVLHVISGLDTFNKLSDCFNEPVHVLHVLAHGTLHKHEDEGVLVFEDGDGDAEFVNAGQLRSLIQKQRGQTRLVLLNACLGAISGGKDMFGSVGAALMQGGAPAVIAMQFEVPAETATNLTHVFYTKLAAGASVGLALTEARLSLSRRNRWSLDWAIPVLFSRADESVLVMKGRDSSPPADQQLALPQPNGTTHIRRRQPPASPGPDFRLIVVITLMVLVVALATNASTLRNRLAGEHPQTVTTTTPQLPTPSPLVPTAVPNTAVATVEVNVPRSPNAIGPSTAANVTQLMNWSKGRVLDTTWVHDSSRLLIVTSIGFYQHETDTYSQVAMTAFSQKVDVAVISPDGQLFATSATGGPSIQIWNTETGSIITTIQEETEYEQLLTFSPDGQLLAAGFRGNRVLVYRARTGELQQTLEDARMNFDLITFSPDGKLLALSGAQTQGIQLWNVASGQLESTIETAGVTGGMRFSPDGAQLMISIGSTIEVRDTANGQLVNTYTPVSWGGPVAFDPNGRQIAIGDMEHNSTIKLLDVATGEQQTIQALGDVSVRLLVFGADGGLLAIVSDTNVQVWDLAKQRLTHSIDGFMRVVGSLAFTIDGVNLAVGQSAGVVLRNISTGQIERVFAEIPWNGAIVYSADGRYIAAGGLKTEIRSASSGQLIHKLEGGGYNFDFSRNGAWLATTDEPYSSDKTVELWDTNTGRLIRTLSYEKEYFFDVKISPDDTTVAAGGGGAVVLWDLQTGRSLQNLTDPIDNGAYYTIAFSPDGTILAAGGLNQLVHLWDTHTGELLDTLEVDKGIIRSIAFSPDGRLLAVGSSTGTLSLWDPSRGMLLASLSEHHDEIRRVAFSPEGDILATTSYDDTVRLWGIP